MGSSHIVKPIERRPRCRWGHRRELGAFRDSDVTTAYEETALQLFLRSLACAAVPILRVVNPPGGEVRNIHPPPRSACEKRPVGEQVGRRNCQGPRLSQILSSCQGRDVAPRACELGLGKQCPVERQVMDSGKIVATPELGGLHHRYERLVA
jgi:hypothetical protein